MCTLLWLAVGFWDIFTIVWQCCSTYQQASQCCFILQTGILYWSGKIYSILGSPLAKIRITWKKPSNESCLEIEFRSKKSVSPYVYPPLPWVELWGLKDWYVWNIIIIKETANYFHFRAQCCQKYASHSKQSFKYKFSELNFEQKRLRALIYLTQSGPRWPERLTWKKYYIALLWQKILN